MYKFLASACVAMAVALTVTPAPTLASGPGRGNPRPLKVEGTITGVNLVTGQVAITTISGQTVVVVAVPATKIERNGMRVPLGAFRLGDRGQALFAANGVAFKIEAVGP